MAEASQVTSGKTVGSTTKGAATGAGLSGAVATIAMYVLAKTGVETDPEVASVLAGALVTLLAGAGALLGGKLSPTDQGDALYAAGAVEQVMLMTARLAALSGSGPMAYEPTPGEQPIVDPVAPEAPAGGSTAAPAAPATPADPADVDASELAEMGIEPDPVEASPRSVEDARAALDRQLL